MEISLDKTNTLVSAISEIKVSVRGTEFKQVDEFTYLGTVHTEESNSVRESKVKIGKAISP